MAEPKTFYNPKPNCMNLHNLKDVIKNEPAFRLKQIKKAVYQDLIENWSEATTLSLDLREKLNKKISLDINGEIFPSKDQEAVKALITLEGGLKIEAVLMQHKEDRNTVCVSSQIGCPLGCIFCATGKLEFKRNLKAEEIVEQVIFFARHLKKKGKKITNVVYMGMGEPFLNYDNVIESIKILNDKDGFNLGARRMSISTVGITEGIDKLADEGLEVNLAISLHAPNDEIRSRLIPYNINYPIKKIFKALENYIKKTRRRVMLEYIMIKGENDSDEQAHKLAKLIKGMKNPLCFVNLIAYNPTGIFKPSDPQRIKEFKSILEQEHIDVTERHRFGRDVKAACGQLVYSKSRIQHTKVD